MENRGTPGTPDLVRFGRMVKARRDALGLTQEEVSALGGPTDTTFTKIENLTWTPGRAGTLKKLDAGLRWEAGSSARILYEGGDPIDVRAASTPEADRTNTDMALEVSLLIESGLQQIYDALRRIGEPNPERAVGDLDAAAYLAERLALQLAGSGEEFTRRRRVVRAQVRARLDLSADIYLDNGDMDPERLRLAPETDPDVAAEMNRRFSPGGSSPDVG